ncbi:hypothetical protein AAHA92_21915 [Salvia divinorum]|uniref:Myb/SANT-like domain-containing protein n=1 Tax=Salvia divinorum TaxID=28513 RepID=A0ABD1GM17_SALDI
MNIPPQAVFLYKGAWSPTCDTTFVDCLLTLKGETKWTRSVFPSWFLLTPAKEIKHNAGIMFSEKDLKDRAEVLQMRYHTFRYVLRQRGVTWDMPLKSVIALDEVWKKIFKLNKFVRAYYYKEEHMYSKLACLFGMDDVKVEGAPEVVVISDTTEQLPLNEIGNEDLGEQNDEVTSSLRFPRLDVCRKLFDVDIEADDRESTMELGIYFIDLAPDGQLRIRVENGRALPKQPRLGEDQGGPSTRSPHASSCGSNSPMGWWPHLHK